MFFEYFLICKTNVRAALKYFSAKIFASKQAWHLRAKWKENQGNIFYNVFNPELYKYITFILIE